MVSVDQQIFDHVALSQIWLFLSPVLQFILKTKTFKVTGNCVQYISRYKHVLLDGITESKQ